MFYTGIRIGTVDELIRHVLFKNAMPTMPASIHPTQTRVHDGVHEFDLVPGVVEKAIAEAWLIPVSDGYQFDYERADEWQSAEDERIRRALSILTERNIRARFDNHCGEWRHHDSMENNTRGFIFVDDHRNQYLVTHGGSVVPIPHLTII